MDLLSTPLRNLLAQVAEVVRDADAEQAFQRASDAEFGHLIADIAELGRLAEALLVDAVGEAERRSVTAVRDDRLTSRFGCRNVNELVQTLARVDARSASRLERAASRVRPGVSDLSGELLDAEYPEVRKAVHDGVIGVDGILAITDPLEQASPRVSAATRREAAAIVVAEARGEGPDGAPPACAALLRIQAQTWALALDQDGAEPRDRIAERKRSLILGAPTAGGVPIRGLLLPEVAAQLQTIFDAQLAPKVAFDDPLAADSDSCDTTPFAERDTRTRAQKQHDALAAALGVAASSGLLPTLGGYAPTLVVSVDAGDLASGTGYAHLEGCDVPISVSVARRIGCCGTIERITSRDGRILKIGTTERVFNRHQRRAIALRDGGCVIPGCGTPAAWCEIHHVLEYAEGGPTHTDNGVLLCWYHHRFLDRIGWLLRMNRGVPEVKAPPWLESDPVWRPVTTSPTRLKAKVDRRRL